MVISARTLASGVSIACCNALVAVFLALEVWDRLGVFGGVRGHSVSADAVVAKGGLSRLVFEHLEQWQGYSQHRSHWLQWCLMHLGVEGRAGGTRLFGFGTIVLRIVSEVLPNS